MENNKPKQIAIFTDAHALKEPVEAVLEDIRKRGITEIYSLGDNIGVGPNPSEVIDLLEENNVKSIAGNSEEYVTLGIEPFSSYFNTLKTQSQLWTLSKLNEHQKGIISLYPHSIELLLGGKKLALCHFANDVRSDFTIHSTWSYQSSIERNKEAYKQFLYTNSEDQIEYLKRMVDSYGKDSAMVKGFLSSLEDPLFKGQKVDMFDAIIQGHVHWKLYEESDSTDFYSIRAVGMAYKKDPIDTASYVILTENKDKKGFKLEEMLVEFDREKMIYNILNCTNPDQTIHKFVELDKPYKTL